MNVEYRQTGEQARAGRQGLALDPDTSGEVSLPGGMRLRLLG
jgi:hypothetical protein